MTRSSFGKLTLNGVLLFYLYTCKHLYQTVAYICTFNDISTESALYPVSLSGIAAALCSHFIDKK